MPTLDPYPGESLEYYEAYDGADGTLYGDVYYRDDAGRTLASGDVWKVWYRSDWQVANRYLDDPGADVAVSWVLEVVSGTGTISASEGIDPDYGDPDAAAPTTLGTFTVTGPGTLVIPSALMDAAYIVEGDDTCLVRLECTSGAIVVQQAKIRVWPVGGARGGWVNRPTWTAAEYAPTAHVVETTGTTTHSSGADADTYEGSWDAAIGGMASGPPLGSLTHTASPGATFTIDTGFDLLTSGGIGNQTLTDLDPLTITTNAVAASSLAVIVGAHWEAFIGDDPALGVEGVDWVRPPTEVADDTAALYPQLGSGSTGWSGDTALTWTTDATTPGDEALGSLTLYAQALEDVPLEVVSGTVYIGPVVVASGAALTDNPDDAGGASLPGGAGRFLLLVASHSVLTETYDWPGTTGGALGGPFFGLSGAVTVGALRAYATMPAYRVWLHTATRTRPLRQLHRDDGRGGTPPAAFGGASRSRTGRAFGYV